MSNQETNHKECEGCLDREECALEPYFIDHHDNKIECPCSTCLIKGICIKACDEFNKFYTIYLRNKNEQIRNRL